VFARAAEVWLEAVDGLPELVVDVLRDVELLDSSDVLVVPAGLGFAEFEVPEVEDF